MGCSGSCSNEAYCNRSRRVFSSLCLFLNSLAGSWLPKSGSFPLVKIDSTGFVRGKRRVVQPIGLPEESGHSCTAQHRRLWALYRLRGERSIPPDAAFETFVDGPFQTFDTRSCFCSCSPFCGWGGWLLLPRRRNAPYCSCLSLLGKEPPNVGYNSRPRSGQEHHSDARDFSGRNRRVQ